MEQIESKLGMINSFANSLEENSNRPSVSAKSRWLWLRMILVLARSLTCRCSLVFLRTPSYLCQHCQKDHPGLTFHCRKCKFQLDIECKLLTIAESEVEEQVQCISHGHVLTLIEEEEGNDVACCGACGKSCSGPTYWCDLCRFWLHKSCVELPRKIQHFLHQCSYTLELQMIFSFYCDACGQDRFGFKYSCQQCGFNSDVECGLLPTIKCEGQEQIENPLHGHPLIPCEETGDKVCCRLCKIKCLGPAYCCSRCNFFLHKSCALQTQFQHPSHPSHPLFPGYATVENFGNCNLCHQDFQGMFFKCDECKFQLDTMCFLNMPTDVENAVVPTVKYVGHNHLLAVVEEKYNHNKLQCRACSTCCVGFPAICCLQCDFSLHLLCGPLPINIKHDCHMHPFTLMDYVVEDNCDEYYCHACEEERDPRLCVYYCSNCLFTADVKCVISEVMASLRGERGDVVLRTVGGKITTDNEVICRGIAVEKMEQNKLDQDKGREEMETKSPFSFTNMIASFTEDEKKEFLDIIETMGKGWTSSEDEEEENKMSSASGKDEDFTHLIKTLDSIYLSATMIHSELSEHNEELASFVHGDCWIFLNILEKLKNKYGDVSTKSILNPRAKSILEDFNARYGDISAEAMLRPRVKSLFLTFLVELIHSMSTTKVVDITLNALHHWWQYAKLLKQAGFKIQFLFDHLKLVASAYLGLATKELADNTVDEEEKEIKRISNEIKNLTAKLEALKEQRKHRISYSESTITSSMRQHFANASKMKWKPAAHPLL